MEADWLVFPLLGIAAGLLAGLLGVGGGLVLVAALAWLLPGMGIPPEAAMHAALASSLASIVLTAAASARAHARRGAVLWRTAAWIAPGVLIGGLAGSAVAVHVSGGVLRLLVAAYCLAAAAQLALVQVPERPPGPAPAGLGLTAAGLGIGVVSALVGIGGGSMTVPLLVWRRVPPVRAVATSSACGVVIGLGAALGYALHQPPGGLGAHAVGYVHLPAAIGVAAASVLAAPWGTRLAHRLSGRDLKRIFALFLVAVGVSLLVGG